MFVGVFVYVCAHKCLCGGVRVHFLFEPPTKNYRFCPTGSSWIITGVLVWWGLSLQFRRQISPLYICNPNYLDRALYFKIDPDNYPLFNIFFSLPLCFAVFWNSTNIGPVSVMSLKHIPQLTISNTCCFQNVTLKMSQVIYCKKNNNKNRH